MWERVNPSEEVKVQILASLWLEERIFFLYCFRCYLLLSSVKYYFQVIQVIIDLVFVSLFGLCLLCRVLLQWARHSCPNIISVYVHAFVRICLDQKFCIKGLAEPYSRVDSVQDLRRGGRWFDPPLGQYSFRGLMVVIATVVMWESSQYWEKEFRESIGRCTSRHGITEITLKAALNINWSVMWHNCST